LARERLLTETVRQRTCFKLPPTTFFEVVGVALRGLCVERRPFLCYPPPLSSKWWGLPSAAFASRDVFWYVPPPTTFLKRVVGVPRLSVAGLRKLKKFFRPSYPRVLSSKPKRAGRRPPAAAVRPPHRLPPLLAAASGSERPARAWSAELATPRARRGSVLPPPLRWGFLFHGLTEDVRTVAGSKGAGWVADESNHPA